MRAPRPLPSVASRRLRPGAAAAACVELYAPCPPSIIRASTCGSRCADPAVLRLSVVAARLPRRLRASSAPVATAASCGGTGCRPQQPVAVSALDIHRCDSVRRGACRCRRLRSQQPHRAPSRRALSPRRWCTCAPMCSISTISTRGGTLERVDLLAYPLVKGEATRVRLENHDSPQTLYELRVGPHGSRQCARTQRTSPASTASAATTALMAPRSCACRSPGRAPTASR